MRKCLMGAAVATCAVASLLNSAAADTTNIVYANYLGLKHSTNPVLEQFFEDVEQETDGSVTFEAHFASSLLGPKDIPSGVRDGLADAGYFVGVYVPSEMPVDNYLADFMVLNNDALAMTGATNELILFECEECAEEYEKGFNTKFLATYALTDYLLQCKEEYRSLDDLNGTKIRGFGAMADLIREMGGVPISMSTNDMYEGLERGTIDCATHSITSQRTRSLGEVADNVILNSLGGFTGASLFNLRLEKWNELTPDERRAMMKHIPHLVARSVMNYIELDEEVRKEMEAKGNKFYYADQDVADFLAKFRENYVDFVVAKGKERGIKKPQEIAEKVIALKEKWVGLLEEHGRDIETFEKLLWDEIYSKVAVK
ncbi:C4-dicarboxylate TRAP transporter substrate-binding protein [Ferruginivarius sediminum]|nr:C4-dicarboxylate TRAP transporter substrate-binding protein [Ferruginivarius sediminum]